MQQSSEGERQLADVVHRNIATLIESRRAVERRKTWAEAAARGTAQFAGSLRFVYILGAFVAVWIVVNAGWVPGIEPFDPYPFVLLAMIASVGAIVLSTFVLITQNQMSAMAERRADLDLQISLLAEHEITRLITLVDGIAEKLEVSAGRDAHLDELKRDVPPDMVLSELERAERHGPSEGDE